MSAWTPPLAAVVARLWALPAAVAAATMSVGHEAGVRPEEDGRVEGPADGPTHSGRMSAQTSYRCRQTASGIRTIAAISSTFGTCSPS
jgi:hypothetical protein